MQSSRFGESMVGAKRNTVACDCPMQFGRKPLDRTVMYQIHMLLMVHQPIEAAPDDISQL